MDDWADDYENETRMSRRTAAKAKRTSGGLGRDERFVITLAATAALMLVIGGAVGFALGRATSRPSAPAAVATTTPEPTTTPASDATVSAEVAVPIEPPPAPAAEPTVSAEPLKTPRQLAPDDGDYINADRVTLKWSSVTDPTGRPVTYAFEIQTRVNGTYTDAQVIDGLTKTSYSARVLAGRRRWRVWAVDADGKASPKSDWSYYQHTATSSSSKPASSTATTGTH